MSANDDELKIRDKFAIEILSGLIANASGDGKYMVGDIETNSISDIKKYIKATYKIADLMRKIRLEVFE